MDPVSCVGAKCDLAAVKAAGQASGDDLAIINSGFSLKKLTADAVAVYTAKVCSDAIDRDNERFTLDALADLSATLPGKSLLEAHAWGPVGIGLWYKSWLELDPSTGVTWLMGSFYVLTATQDGTAMIAKLNGGVAKYVSIGFHCPAAYEVTRPDGSKYVELDRGADGEHCESLEASLVFLGAQPNAGVIKSVTTKAQKRLEQEHQEAMAGVSWTDCLLPKELRG